MGAMGRRSSSLGGPQFLEPDRLCGKPNCIRQGIVLGFAEDMFANNANNGILNQTNFENCLYRVSVKSVSNKLLRLIL